MVRHAVVQLFGFLYQRVIFDSKRCTQRHRQWRRRGAQITFGSQRHVGPHSAIVFLVMGRAYQRGIAHLLYKSSDVGCSTWEPGGFELGHVTGDRPRTPLAHPFFLPSPIVLPSRFSQRGRLTLGRYGR